MLYRRSSLTHLLALGLALGCFAGTTFASGPQEKLLYSFQGSSAPNLQDGEGPGELITDENGNLYGVTAWGGVCNMSHHLSYPCGTVFELSPPATEGGSWTETVLYEFGTNPLDGQDPRGNLIRDKQGNLYGTTFASSGGYDANFGCGNFFELLPPAQLGDPWTETILYNFQGNNDGCGPIGTLVADSKGNIFGATISGGSQFNAAAPKGYSDGGIFEMSPPTSRGGNWTESFTQAQGLAAFPTNGLAIDRQGILYGATASYASTVGPTIFQLVPPASPGGTWIATTLYTFQGGSDGASPAGLTLDAKGNLYGVTQDGGTAGYGTAFKLSPSQGGGSWTKSILYSFLGGNDGLQPIARMTFDKAGNLYGTTYEGGGAAACSAFQGCGTVFKLTRSAGSWSERVLYRFQGGPIDGGYVNSPPLVAGHTIYGTTAAGGTVSPNYYGVVYEIK